MPDFVRPRLGNRLKCGEPAQLRATLIVTRRGDRIELRADPLRWDDRALADEVAEFKGKFFRAKDTNGNQIDYAAAVSGGLQLVPDAQALKTLEADYKKMADDGILLDDAEPFADLIKRCADLEKRANAKGKGT